MTKSPLEQIDEEMPQPGRCQYNTVEFTDLPDEGLRITSGFCARDTGGHPTTCVAHRGERTAAEGEEFAQLVTSMLDAGNPRFQGFVFPVAFGGFRDRVVSCNANFEKTVFLGDADFTGCRFSGEVCFTEAAFGGSAIFRASVVTAVLCFTASQISGDVCFESVSVDGDLDFTVSRIHGSVLLDKARIGGETDLMQVSVEGGVSMKEACFSGDVILTTADIGGNLTAIGASFARVPVFDGTTIRGKIFMRPSHFWVQYLPD